MKRLNFDKLKSISTPDEWLENAVNIPNQKKNAPLPFYRHTSFLTSAVCAALCAFVGLIVLFNAQSGKVPVSENPITTTSAALQPSIPQSNPEHNKQGSDNHNGSAEQIVTEPSERTSDNSNTLGTQAATNNSATDSSSPTSGSGTNPTATTIKSNLSATDNTEATQAHPSVAESTSPDPVICEPSTQAQQTEPPTEEPVTVYTNLIFLHVDLNSGFNFSNTVGCHIKEVGGKDLYPYNSAYEKCDFVEGTSGWDSVENQNVCFVYNNKGPNKIVYGLYEVTFYDVNGNTITRTVNISDNNSVHIF